MKHNVIVKHGENKVLKVFWVMSAMKNKIVAEYDPRTTISSVCGTEKCVVQGGDENV